jgi:hypothetical protein
MESEAIEGAGEVDEDHRVADFEDSALSETRREIVDEWIVHPLTDFVRECSHILGQSAAERLSVE